MIPNDINLLPYNQREDALIHHYNAFYHECPDVEGATVQVVWDFAVVKNLAAQPEPRCHLCGGRVTHIAGLTVADWSEQRHRPDISWMTVCETTVMVAFAIFLVLNMA